MKWPEDFIGKVIQGDCLDVMREMPDKCVDAIITDPPYGIGFKYNTYDDTWENWKKLMSRCIPEWHRICKGPIIFPSCNRNGREWLWKNFPPRWTICWHKGSPGHAAAIGFNDWEDLHVMGENIHRNAHDHFYAKPSDNDNTGHPCAKSLDYYRWQITRFLKPGHILFEPFAGSGGGCLVAEQGGRKWIGVELDLKYCDIARKRIDDEKRQGKLF